MELSNGAETCLESIAESLRKIALLAQMVTTLVEVSASETFADKTKPAKEVDAAKVLLGVLRGKR